MRSVEMMPVFMSISASRRTFSVPRCRELFVHACGLVDQHEYRELGRELDVQPHASESSGNPLSTTARGSTPGSTPPAAQRRTH